MYDKNCPTKCNNIQFVYICKPLYMFRVVSPPIISSSCHCTQSISCRERDWTGTAVPVQSRSRQVSVTVLLMPDAVDTVIWALDDGWGYHPKHVEQFADTNKPYIVASSWMIIDTYYAMHGPLNIKLQFAFKLRRPHFTLSCPPISDITTEITTVQTTSHHSRLGLKRPGFMAMHGKYWPGPHSSALKEWDRYIISMPLNWSYFSKYSRNTMLAFHSKEFKFKLHVHKTTVRNVFY